MQLLMTLAVLVYAPAGGQASAAVAPVERALVEAARADGVQVVREALAQARARHQAGWVEAPALAFFGRARAAVANGRRALERVELGAAADAFAAAEQIYRGALTWPGAAAEAATAALWHGVALFELGRARAAAEAWRRAVALEPTTTLTEAEVRPDVARAFAQALRGRPMTSLVVTVELAAPGDAEVAVAVDGLAAGVVRPGVPLRLAVAEGEHWIAARAPGLLPAAALVSAGPAETNALLRLEADATSRALAGLEHAPSPAGLDALQRLLDLDGVVVAALARDAGKLTVVASRHGRGCGSLPAVEVVAPRDEAEPRAAARALLGRLGHAGCHAGAPLLVLEAPPIAAPRPPPPVPLAPPRPPRAWERPWLWMTVVGAVAVSVVVVANVWPRSTSYSASVDFGSFGGQR